MRMARRHGDTSYLRRVGPIAVRQLIRRQRRHLAGLLVLVALAGAVAVHHSGMGMDDMDHMTSGPAAAMCLGVAVVAGAAIALVAIGELALGRWRPAPVLNAALDARAAQPPGSRAREGPRARLPVLCVWRT